MKIKTNRLTGVELDWAVGKCRGITLELHGIVPYSTDWAHGGPVIEQEVINLGRHTWDDSGVIRWGASKAGLFQGAPFSVGPTPLIAAMRCYVASKLGEEVEVPDGLA